MFDLINIKRHEPIINNIERPGAERNVLAYILNKSDSIYDATTKLEESDFNNSLNRLIYRCMMGLAEKGVRVSVENILAITKSKGVLDKDGEEYLYRIAQTDISGIDFDHNVEQVLVASLKRRAYLQSLHVMKDCVDDKLDFDDAGSFVGRQQQRFMELGLEANDNVKQIGEGVFDWLEERAKNPTLVPGLSTGFPELDGVIGGFIPGRLYVFAGRAKSGKSLLLNNFATHICIAQDKPVLYIDTEMSTFEDVRPRILAIISGVSERDISNGMYIRNEEDREKVERAAKLLTHAPFYHTYMPNFSITKVLSLVRKYKVKYGIEALFFDYIKMPMSQSVNQLKEYQLLGLITSALKDVVGELGIPGITACQLNRNALHSDEPDEGDVGGSDRILFNASYLFYLWQKDPERILEDGGIESGNMVLKLGASRHGGEYRAFLRRHESNARMWEVVKV